MCLAQYAALRRALVPSLAYFLAINLIAGFPCGSLAPRSRKNRYCSARLARPRPGPRDRLYVGRDLPLVTYSAQNGAVFARSRTLLSPRNAPRSPLDESGAGPRRPGGAPGSHASALSENRKSYRTPTQIFAADRETGLTARGWQFRGREARHVAVVMEPRRLPASADNVEA